MRRWSRVLAAALTASVLAGCGAAEPGPPPATGMAAVCGNATGEGPRVGLALAPDDGAGHWYNESAFAGVRTAVEDLGATCRVERAADDEGQSARVGRLRALAEAGMDPVVAVGGSYTAALVTLAGQYPTTSFAVVGAGTGARPALANLAYLGFADNQGSFLAGVVAALKSQTNRIGFVGGVRDTGTQAFEAGYVAGARAVKPGIVVQVRYLQARDPRGLADPAAGNRAARAEYDAGADVVYQAAEASGAGVFRAAVAANAWAIGSRTDQYGWAASTVRSHVLTSMVENYDVAVLAMVRSVSDGSPLSGTQTFGLAEEAVGYAVSGGFVDDIRATVDDYAAKVRAGEIEVPSVPGRL